MRTSGLIGVMLSLAWLLCFPSGELSACTTAVISGKATRDGRPLLWKNRDTSTRENEVIFLPAGPGRRAVLGVANAKDRGSIWMGTNDAGFCIENSVSGDLTGPDGVKGKGNGGFMTLALQTCATVADFERLLEETNITGRSTKSNFGVIDSQGGAALFETSTASYVKYDALDPQSAPAGYIVRSNFAFSAPRKTSLRRPDNTDVEENIAEIYSGPRYLRGCRLMKAGVSEGQLDAGFLVRNCTRDWSDSRGVPYPGSVNGPPGELPEIINTAATISRRTTVSAAVFQGVRPGEDPALTTLWAMLGDPSFTVAVPCWIKAGTVAAELDGPRTSPLSDLSIQLRNAHYIGEPAKPAASTATVTTPAAPSTSGTLTGTAGDGGAPSTERVRTTLLPEVWNHLRPVEAAILEETADQLASWRQHPPDAPTVAAFHRLAAQRALEALTAAHGVE